MSTPLNRPKLRVGLSRQSGSKIFTPPCLTSADNTSASTTSVSTTTPDVSTKKGVRATAAQKRRLEFAADTKIKQEKTEEVNYETMDLEELRKLVAEKRKKAEIQERHGKEQEELKALIDKWKQAGNDGLQMLIKIILPTPTIEQLLDSFKMRHDEFE